ncbi:hypothetical protein AALO_G00234250 [Alosa alosa]|uniref:Uncharacterized protein n=1 Tax=Alosa alosa TaxID=278164 RepID=A0AAV6FV78_9TELE|nr:hypothetical protein AALO_G00234250 [Alosa alosa]
MSQSGKVYHVYVEVRDGEGLDPLMLQGPDMLPQSQRTSPHHSHSHSPAVSPGTLHKGGGSNQSLSSSRHSVNFHLGPIGYEQGRGGGPHRQSLPCDGLGHLLSGQNGILMRAHSAESEPFCCRENHVSGSYIEKGSVQTSADGSHSSLCQSEPENPFNRALEEEEERLAGLTRKRLSDPVQFSSWESLGGSGSKLTSAQRHSLNLRRATLDSIAREATYRALEEFGSPQIRRRLEVHNHHPYPHRQDQLPHDQSRSRSWGGSPVLPVRGSCTLPTNTHLVDLDRNHSAYGLPRSPATEHLSSHVRQNHYTMFPPSGRPHAYGAPNHQRQWHGEDSPKLPYKHGPALPSCKPTAIQHEIPAMTVTKAPDHHHQKSNHQPADSPRSSHRVNFNLDASKSSKAGTDEGANHLSGQRSVSPSTSPDLARKLAEEASKLSTIFMERRSPSPAPSSGEDTNRSDSPRSGSLSRESQVYPGLQGLGSPAQSHSDVSLPCGQQGDHHWAAEREPVRSASQSGHSSPLPPYRSGATPSPARLAQHRLDMTPSPIRDPRLEMGESAGKASPTPHRHQPPQYTGDGWSPGTSDRRQQQPPATRFNPQPQDSSPETQRRGYYAGQHASETPVSWTSQLQRWREERQMRELERSGQPPAAGTPPLASSREEEKRRRDIPATERGGGGGGGGGGGTPGLSKSSSGVTGSLGDSSSQPERDCLSTESSSQGSDSGNNTAGAQSEGSSDLGSSVRSQKIARAKWEFLFGAPTQDEHGTKDPSGASTAPSSGRSGKPTTTSSPSSLPRKPQRSRKALGLKRDELQRLSYHEVQHVEVELVAETPTSSRHASPGTSPRMGIIRRTIKYSETDLDAVPMRCYRETDLDEVMQAEHEEDEEGAVEGAGGDGGDGDDDLAFGSERSGSGLATWGAAGGGRGPGWSDWWRTRREWSAGPPSGCWGTGRGSPSDSHADNQSNLKSPVTVGNPRRISAEGLDTFSRHFESIMESHRAKGTSYSSLDSDDMTPSVPPVFTFDLPTLTPEIQSQICVSARQIAELGFAPLARAEALSLSDRTGGSDPTLAPFKEEAGSGSEDDTTTSAMNTPMSDDNLDSALRSV